MLTVPQYRKQIFKECIPENFNEIHIHCVLIICFSKIHVQLRVYM